MSGSGESDDRSAAGHLIRGWRKRRRLSQMELAFEARLSPRHMSFIETGRSRPSRDALLSICSALDVPLRERNVLLEAAGHAREYSEEAFDADANDHLRSILTRLLAGHEPWFAVAVDHRWDILLANGPAESILQTYFDRGGVPGPRNLLRLTLHPEGLRPALLNLEAVAGRLLGALDAEVAVRTEDHRLGALRDEVAGYGPEGRSRSVRGDGIPMRLQTDCGEARLLTVLMTFDNPLDPVTEEVRIETLLPADPKSDEVLREAFARFDPPPTEAPP